jgi:hypothetical protein
MPCDDLAISKSSHGSSSGASRQSPRSIRAHHAQRTSGSSVRSCCPSLKRKSVVSGASCARASAESTCASSAAASSRSSSRTRPFGLPFDKGAAVPRKAASPKSQTSSAPLTNDPLKARPGRSRGRHVEVHCRRGGPNVSKRQGDPPLVRIALPAVFRFTLSGAESEPGGKPLELGIACRERLAYPRMRDSRKP